MRNGFKVYDTDTHLHPTAETIEKYFDPPMRARMPELEKFKGPVRKSLLGAPTEPWKHEYRFPGRVVYKRILGQAGPPEIPPSNIPHFNGTVAPSAGARDDNPDARVRDMDTEGIDVALMIPGVPTDVFLMNDPELEMGFIRAHNRFLADFCGAHPHRLKSLLTVTANAIEESVEEVKKWKGASWAVGVWPLTMEKPIDHPDFEPLWKAAVDQNLSVVHHSYTWNAPFFPGHNDLWDNVFLGRSAAHPWGAMRFVGAFIGGGVMDRYPTIRCGILESCCTWLPFWAARLDDQAVYVGETAPLKHKVSDYMKNGRFFASLEMPEGDRLVKTTIEYMGENVLMWASDYPHSESHFPNTADIFLGWKALSATEKRKMMWDNPVRFYGEP